MSFGYRTFEVTFTINGTSYTERITCGSLNDAYRLIKRRYPEAHIVRGQQVD